MISWAEALSFRIVSLERDAPVARSMSRTKLVTCRDRVCGYTILKEDFPFSAITREFPSEPPGEEGCFSSLQDDRAANDAKTVANSKMRSFIPFGF